MNRLLSSLTSLRGRVTLAVLAVTSCLYSLLGSLGFLQIAYSGREAIRDRIDQVLDQLELGVTTGGSAVGVDTADGVSADVYGPGSSAPPEQPGEMQVVRSVEVEGAVVTLVGSASEARLTDSLESLYRGMWVGIPLAAVVSAVAAGLATKRALRPVGAITTLAASIGTDDLRRVPVPDTADEIEQLARTLNAMLDRIDAGTAAQRQFTSDAAHELRTPLMALQGEVELAARSTDTVDPELFGRLDQLLQRLGARVDDLLLLATLDEGRTAQRSTTGLAALAGAEADDLGLDVIIDGDADVSIDAALIRRAVRNLLANAARYRRNEVRVLIEQAADRVWVHVNDDGPGVPEEQRDAVFDRFTRLDHSRHTHTGGAGLGLAIVQSVADAHDGGTACTESPLGGARCSLWLPAATTAATP